MQGDEAVDMVGRILCIGDGIRTRLRALVMLLCCQWCGFVLSW